MQNNAIAAGAGAGADHRARAVLRLHAQRGRAQGPRGRDRGTRRALYRIVYFFPQVLSVVIIACSGRRSTTRNSGLLNGALRAVGLTRCRPGWATRGRLLVRAGGDGLEQRRLLRGAVRRGHAGHPAATSTRRRCSTARPGSTTLRRITLPLLWDTVQVAWVYLAIVALDGFILVQMMTNGGPELLHRRDRRCGMYDTAFGSETKFGYASAIGVVMFFLTLSVAVAGAAGRPGANGSSTRDALDNRAPTATDRADRRRPAATPRTRRRQRLLARLPGGLGAADRAAAAVGVRSARSRATARSSPTRGGCPATLRLDNWARAWTDGAHRPVLPQQRRSWWPARSRLTMLLGAIAAYVWPGTSSAGSRLVYYLFVGGMMFPVFLALVPLFFVVTQRRPARHLPGLILVYAAYSLPFTVFFLTAFFRTLPTSVAEAAMVDGCGHFRLFFRVMLPMARPGLISVGIFNFLGHWNQYLLPHGADAAATRTSGCWPRGWPRSRSTRATPATTRGCSPA